MDVEDVTLQNFSNIFKIIISNTGVESLLFREFGWNARTLVDFLFFLTSFALAFSFALLHTLMLQENFADAMFQFAVICHDMSFIVRIFSIIINRHKIMALTSIDFSEFNCNRYRPKSSLNTLNRSYVYLKKLNKFMKGYFMVFLCGWYILPAIASKSFLGFLEGRNGFEEVLKALPTTFPKDGASTALHMLSWTYHILLGTSWITVWATSDILCFGITILLKKQYEILSNSLVWQFGIARDSAKPLGLKPFVQDHVKLIRMTYMLGDILSPIVLAQMMQTILTTACGTYMASQPTANSGKQLTTNFVAYSALSLLELMAFCWQSHIAKQANEDLGHRIYQASLSEPLDRNNKDWFLPLLMSQKTIKFKALGLVEIKMETCVVVLRASYSYYALIQAKT